MPSSISLPLDGPAKLSRLSEAPAGLFARNVRLQILRGAAASAVLLYHASIYLRREHGDAVFLAIFDDRFGLYGVAVFFAISGYLMAHLVRTSDPWSFLSHRVLRIYPIYVLVVGAWIALGPLVNASPRFDAIGLLLVPGDARPYPLGVEWSLIFETTYYVLLFLLALAGLQRWLETIAVGWIAGILAVTLFAPSWQEGVLFPLPLI